MFKGMVFKKLNTYFLHIPYSSFRQATRNTHTFTQIGLLINTIIPLTIRVQSTPYLQETAKNVTQALYSSDVFKLRHNLLYVV